MRRVEVALLAAVLLAVGCAPHLQPQIWISNGGVGPRAAACTEASLRIDAERVLTSAPGASGCGADAAMLASDVGAAYAFVQTETAAAPVGPVVASPVSLGVLGLASGSSEQGLASGSSERGLASGSSERGLASGSGERGLVSRSGERGLASGSSERGLVSGSGERGLVAGSSEQALASGSSERAPWSLRKQVTPSTARDGGAVRFTLTFTNDRGARVLRLVLVDRVDARLHVTAAPGAQAFALEDGSTLLVWDDRVPLPSRSSRSVTFDAVVDLGAETPPVE